MNNNTEDDGRDKIDDVFPKCWKTDCRFLAFFCINFGVIW